MNISFILNIACLDIVVRINVSDVGIKHRHGTQCVNQSIVDRGGVTAYIVAVVSSRVVVSLLVKIALSACDRAPK